MEHNHKRYGTGLAAGKDYGIHEGQAKILTKKAPKGYRIIVQEKLDGSNVAVANIDGELVAINRAGYPCVSAPWEQHRLFHLWVLNNPDRFAFLRPGERVCGEWLAQAHGTRYRLPHEPFVAFDIIAGAPDAKGVVPRMTFDEVRNRCEGLVQPDLISDGPPCPVETALDLLRPEVHGALDPIEGCVWRAERDGRVEFLAKYVRPDKVDGCYLPEVSGVDPVWNWRPGWRSA